MKENDPLISIVVHKIGYPWSISYEYNILGKTVLFLFIYLFYFLTD